ncbi:unnamed protein product [Nippostrongylus brasiliensis]|uniref:EGF-like domain-containing protein n=1 Tax=Nippostrongylus brasiliensis TaxID=27835 RepID=A0A0N4XVV1_NIPBR|nr:unnamed protein product [Nippostrongylus brasiliensis]
MLLEVAVLVVIVCEMAPVSATVIGAMTEEHQGCMMSYERFGWFYLDLAPQSTFLANLLQAFEGLGSITGKTEEERHDVANMRFGQNELRRHWNMLTSAPPTSAFAKTSTFNLVIYNAFTDYWGKSGYDLFRNSVAQHLEGFSYSQYNMAVYKGSSAMEQEYRSVVSESKKDDFLTLLQNETLSYLESYSCMNLAFYKPMYNYITKLGLRDTAITVVTQFPAANDDESYVALLELAIAFNIRINVVWISDETFVRCFFLRSTNPQVICDYYMYDNMKQLSSATGGYFVPQKYGPVDSPTDAFVTVFGIDGSNVGIRVYSTLVEDVVIDSSRTQPSTELNKLQIDSCTIRSDKGDTRLLKMTNRATPSAFNFVSSDTFTCDPTTTGLYWAETFAVTAMNNINNTFGYFGVVRFEVQNESAVIYYPQKDIGSMQNAVYNLYRYGGIAGTPQSSDSQFLVALTTATDSPYLYENSLLMFCMDKLPRSPDYTKFTKLTSKNTLFLMDVSAINRELGYKRTAEPLNEIAAATNGHLIVSDQADSQNFANEIKPQSLRNMIVFIQVLVNLETQETDQRLKVKYVDLDMKDLDVGPDTGHSVALYDASQQQQLASSGDAFFVPFFCKNNSSTALCAAGTQDKYHVQYTSTNGFSEMRSFACSNSDTNSAANCLKENSYSDIECTGAQKPFFRGPTGKVLDCSNNGQLQYISATKNYVCNCNAGFTGVSCEIGLCEKPTPAMEEVDVEFRTYTIVIGVDATSYGLESVLLRSVANLTSLSSQPRTIWRYQLILYCDNKQVLPVYIGGSFDDFNAMMTSSLRDTYCSNPAYAKFDLTQVYQSAVSSLGRFVFYTEKQTSMELDLDTFMSVSRNYRQEAFSEMLSSKTSLALLEKNLIGSGSAFIEAGASGYIFLSSRDINAVRVVTGAGTVLSPAQIFGRYSAVFQLSGGSSYAMQGVTSDDFTASVVVLNGITPSSIIVGSMQDDSTTAFASPDSACQNGGSSGVTKCSCPPDYTSVDCSRPLCDQGQLNSWGDACNCDWSSNGGLHCKSKFPQDPLA